MASDPRPHGQQTILRPPPRLRNDTARGPAADAIAPGRCRGPVRFDGPLIPPRPEVRGRFRYHASGRVGRRGTRESRVLLRVHVHPAGLVGRMGRVPPGPGGPAPYQREAGKDEDRVIGDPPIAEGSSHGRRWTGLYICVEPPRESIPHVRVTTGWAASAGPSAYPRPGRSPAAAPGAGRTHRLLRPTTRRSAEGGGSPRSTPATPSSGGPACPYAPTGTHRSSACSATCGISSPTFAPRRPYFLNSNGECQTLPILVPAFGSRPGIGLPSHLAICGFGSNVPIWPGPPCGKT
jgi:hypothetical protein